MDTSKITTPINEKVIKNLNPGDKVEITGTFYIARDQAHKKLIELIKKGKKLPFPLEGQIIYYCGPTPARKGEIIGSAGPTTSKRMDPFTEILLEHGLKGTIGKGTRSKEVTNAIKKHKAVYFVTYGGAGAYLRQFITKNELVAYPELGPEAIRKITVKDFPAYVGIV
ncbi:MAG: FumA C-terminus/TtdB family hydratase beta subunit [bacterium]|nr:FumA C-terminus/TtdB family hydratase beta subunit [bacterium]